MLRLVAIFVLLVFAPVTLADDLPPGATARLGYDSFRAGSLIDYLGFSPDGKLLVTIRKVGSGLALGLWDVETGYRLREHSVMATAGVWGTRGGYAVIRQATLERPGVPAQTISNDFRVWDFTDSQTVPPLTLSTDDFRTMLASSVESRWRYTKYRLSADGGHVAALWNSEEGKHGVHIFELKPADSSAELKRLGCLDLGAEGADDFRISADGKVVVTFRRLAHPSVAETTATVWNVLTGRPAKPVRVGWDFRLMVTPDARGLVAWVDEKNTWGFDHYDLATGHRRHLVRWESARRPNGRSWPVAGESFACSCFAFSSDGQLLVVPVGGKTVVLDLTAGKERGWLEGHAGDHTAVAVSADAARIATADQFGLVRLWDAKTLRPLTDAPGHRAPVEYAQLSPDGKLLLTWAWDETARLWDVASGKELRVFAGVPPLPWGIGADENRPKFSPDGTTIIFGTKERLVARDLQTGLEVPLPAELATRKGRFVAFSPDGRIVRTGGYEGHKFVFEVWDWPGGQLRDCWVQAEPGSLPGFPDVTAKRLPALGDYPGWERKRGSDTNDGQVVDAGTGNRVSRFAFGDKTSRAWGLPLALCPVGWQYAYTWGSDLLVCESATHAVRRKLVGHRGAVRILGFTPDGTKLLTAGGDHTVLVWDMRLSAVPLPDILKKETDAGKLWASLAAGTADEAYLAMVRFARDPDAAVHMVRMRLRPAVPGEAETDSGRVTDARAIELLEAIDTADSRKLLKELATGDPTAFRTQQAKHALERRAEAAPVRSTK